MIYEYFRQQQVALWHSIPKQHSSFTSRCRSLHGLHGLYGLRASLQSSLQQQHQSHFRPSEDPSSLAAATSAASLHQAPHTDDVNLQPAGTVNIFLFFFVIRGKELFGTFCKIKEILRCQLHNFQKKSDKISNGADLRTLT